MRLSAVIAATGSLAASASWARRTVAGSSAIIWPCRVDKRPLEVVDLAGANGRGREHHAETLRVPQRVLVERRGIEEDLGRPARRHDGVAKSLVDAICRNAVLLPDPLELDQVGDHARRGLVDRAFVDGAADSNDDASSLIGIGGHDRRPGPQGVMDGSQAELRQVVLGGQLRDLHRLLEAVEGQDRQVRSRRAGAGSGRRCRSLGSRASGSGRRLTLLGGRCGFSAFPGWSRDLKRH